MSTLKIWCNRWTVLYFFSLHVFSSFSYSLTDPNLVLLNNSLYWSVQQTLWRTFFDNPVLLSSTYFFLMSLVLAAYIGVLRHFPYEKVEAHKRGFLVFLVLMSLPLLFSYNALSHDIFNYIFNAKMVVVYNQNPHIHTALEFPSDEWTRFMHNTHTAAPYGYGWTLLSLIPFQLGFSKFILTWLSFKTWALLSYIALACVYLYSKAAVDVKNAVFVLLNPLVLIEVVSSGHNDLFMMVPAVLAFTIVCDKALPKKKTYALAAVLLLLSISIKLATVVLAPMLLLLILSRLEILKSSKVITSNYAVIASVLMFCLLLTSRSQQFHPWYLMWVLVWLALDSNATVNEVSTFWKNALLILTASSLFRYLPWLYFGTFTDTTVLYQKLITWLPLIVYTGIYLVKNRTSLVKNV